MDNDISRRLGNIPVCSFFFSLNKCPISEFPYILMWIVALFFSTLLPPSWYLCVGIDILLSSGSPFITTLFLSLIAVSSFIQIVCLPTILTCVFLQALSQFSACGRSPFIHQGYIWGQWPVMWNRDGYKWHIWHAIFARKMVAGMLEWMKRWYLIGIF